MKSIQFVVPTAGPLWLVPVLAVYCQIGLAFQTDLRVGYGAFQLDQGSPAPATSALFRLENPEGILVSEAGVGAVEAILRGRIFVEQDGSRSTGVALVNRSQSDEVVRFVLRDMNGQQVASDQITMSPGQHLARFVNELFDDLPPTFVGSLSFQVEGDQRKLAAVTLRQGSNASGEAVFTTLPVADLSEAPQAAPPGARLLFPQIGAGGGLSSQLVLFSRSGDVVQGAIRLFSSSGDPLQLQRNGTTASEFLFQLSPDGADLFEFESPEPSAVRVGYAIVTVNDGVPLPAGSVVFRFVDGQGEAISEAGVGAIASTSRSRIFVDNIRTRTGIAVANPQEAAVRIDFDLLDPSGGLLETASRDLPARGHSAFFADELFALAEGFAGQIEIRSQQPIAPITLKLTTNQRGQSIVTTLPVADLTAPSEGSTLVVPQMGFGSSLAGPFSTRLIFISTQPAGTGEGRIGFRTGEGAAWDLGAVPSEFRFAVGPGESGQISFPLPSSDASLQKGDSASALIGPAGGTISLQSGRGDAITLRVPPQALFEPTTLTVTALTESPRRTFSNNIFPGVLLEPEGLVLNRPAKLQVQLAAPARQPEFARLVWLAGEAAIGLPSSPPAPEDSIEAEIVHFSVYSGDQLTLSEAILWANIIATGGRERYPELDFPDIDGPVVDFLLTLELVNTLIELERWKDLLGADEVTSFDQILGLLEQGALMFLDSPAPDDPCGLYHSFLREFSAISMLLSDPIIDQAFEQRIQQVDGNCITIDVTGTWQVDSFDSVETCRLTAGCQGGGCVWQEAEGPESVEASVVQNGSSFSLSFPEFPEVGTLTGILQANQGNEIEPYSFSVSTDSSTTFDCMIFFETDGLGLDFGAPLCVDGTNCVPLSCRETDTVTGNFSADGTGFLGLEFWDFTASVRESSPQGGSQVLRYRCQGSSSVAGTKQDQ